MNAVLVMLVRGIPTVGGLLAMLEQPTWEIRELGKRLAVDGRFPSRRTWERRLNALPATLAAQIAHLGGHLVELLHPWAAGGCAVAVDDTVLHARRSLAQEASRGRRHPAHLDRYRGALK